MVLPWVAHLYTALGAVLAFAAALCLVDGDFQSAFLALLLATLIDTTDGWLARTLHVQEHLPHFDGARLDDIVDYLTFVFVPMLLVWRAGLLPAGWGVPVGGVVLLASAYGFGQVDAKVRTTDHFFTGFPSYWNIVALYLVLLGLAPAWNAGVVLGLAVLVFVPIGYLYPSRMTSWRTPTLVFGSAWAALIVWIVWRLPEVSPVAVLWSLAFPAYYVVLSLVLHARRVAP